MSTPRVSILVPTLEGESDLGRLLPALERQRFEGGFELRVIDSDSRDGTRALLENAGAGRFEVHVERIDRADFQHGRTRNALAGGARGSILVFLSQDAVPVDEHFLTGLAEAFDDPRVAGAYARILPPPAADPLTARTAWALPEASDAPRLFTGGAAHPPDPTEARLHFNNVASAMRARVWRALPIPEVEFGEDLAWAESALEAGHSIRFVPESAVYHAHRYTPREAFERHRIDAAFQLRHYGHRVRPTWLSVLRGAAYEVREDVRFLLERRPPGALGALLRSPLLRTAQILGQRRGSGPH